MLDKNQLSKEKKSSKNCGQRIYMRSFGCQMNDVDSEVMGRLLEREGCGKIDSPEEVDITIFRKNN